MHSLKSSARIIGAAELSELCALAEDAGNRQDTEYIESHTDELLDLYESYKVKLSRLNQKEEKADLPLISEKELKDAYEALSDVIPQMDYDSVEMILAQLAEYKLPDEDEKKMSKLENMLKSFDWDGMEEMLKQRN